MGGKNYKVHEETFGGNGYVYYFDYGNGFIAFLYVKMYLIIHFINVQFIVCHLGQKTLKTYTKLKINKQKNLLNDRKE